MTASSSPSPLYSGVEAFEAGLADASDWDAFVRHSRSSTFFHLWGWKSVIENSFNYRCRYLIARDVQGRCRGVLPLVHFKNAIAGNAMISTPFLVYGGVAAESPEVANRLCEKAIEIATTCRADYVEMRCSDNHGDSWQEKSRYVTFSKSISSCHDTNLKEIPRKQRAMIRKGEKAGLRGDTEPDVESLYGVVAESYRNLGTPIFTKRLYQQIVDTFPLDVRFTNVRREGKLLSSVMSFRFRDEILPYYGGGIREARQYCANDYMYWCVMRNAVDEGCTSFDFGRSRKDTGSYSFKKHWGFEPRELKYQYYLLRGGQIPDLSPSNNRYSLAIRAWQRLPLAVTRVIGPSLARCLG